MSVNFIQLEGQQDYLTLKKARENLVFVIAHLKTEGQDTTNVQQRTKVR